MPLERINEAFDLMHEGKSICTVAWCTAPGTFV
jgi:Zn-dependent alcohol dehydrogenase